MSTNISKAQSKALDEAFDFGGEDLSQYGTINSILEQFASRYIKNIERYANDKMNVGTGNLLKSMVAEIEDKNGLMTFTLKMLDYYDYPNQGVKGVSSSKNAPSSPYQYKNYGMSKEGLTSIKKYILSGKKRIASVGKDKALGIGLEKKGISGSGKKSLIDREVNTMAYLIKKFGLKASHYFDLAFQDTFRDFDKAVEDALGKDFEFKLEKFIK